MPFGDDQMLSLRNCRARTNVCASGWNMFLGSVLGSRNWHVVAGVLRTNPGDFLQLHLSLSLGRTSHLCQVFDSLFLLARSNRLPPLFYCPLVIQSSRISPNRRTPHFCEWIATAWFGLSPSHIIPSCSERISKISAAFLFCCLATSTALLRRLRFWSLLEMPCRFHVTILLVFLGFGVRFSRIVFFSFCAFPCVGCLRFPLQTLWDLSALSGTSELRGQFHQVS